MIVIDATFDAAGEADPRESCLYLALFAIRNGVKVRAWLGGVQIEASPTMEPDDLWQRWQAMKAGRITADPTPAQEGGEGA